MEKRSHLEKYGTIVTIIVGISFLYWKISDNADAIRADIAANTVATAELRVKVEANTDAIADLRNEFRGEMAAIRRDMAELRGALLSHIGGHNHAPVIAGGEGAAE